MKAYFLFVDYFLPVFIFYLVIRKGTLSIVYLPFLFFAYSVLEKSNHIALYHLMFVLLTVFYMVFHLPFVKRNIFWVLLIAYYFILLYTIKDFKEARADLIGLFLTFTVVPLIPEVFKNYSRSSVFDELSKSAALILGIFIFNSVISTIFKYFPENEYGFSSGVSFGNLGISVYSVLPIAIFIVLKKAIKDKSLLYFALYFGGIFLVLLTLRRTAMAFSILASCFVLVEMLNFKQLKDLVVYGSLMLVVGFFVSQYTGFSDQLIERIEKRNLEERELANEGRFLEFELLYKDLFVYYDYSPWFGYGLFASKGNYGKKVFGMRTLHTDFAYYIHASGLLGLSLYLLMMAKAFWDVYRISRNHKDLTIQFIFLLSFFMAFFLLGNSRNPILPTLFFSLLSLPFAKEKLLPKNQHKQFALK